MGRPFVACASWSPRLTQGGNGYGARMRKSATQMKLHRKFLFAVFGVAVFCAAAGSSALTLGRARGAVLLGQPLKLTVPIQLESGEGLSVLCSDADVFYGDGKQDASRVAVTSDASPQAQTTNVYVSALANVDEPVVTVYLRIGCAAKTSRRYVLLADLANQPGEPPIDANASPRGQSTPVASGVPTKISESVETTQQRPSKRVRTVEPEVQIRQSRSMKSISGNRPSAPLRARLKLAPVDLTVDRDPTLKLSNEMLQGDLDDLQRRAEAVVVWLSLNATPQEVVSAQSRRQAMESDLKGLHDVTAKNHRVLDELTRRLDQAETARYSNPLVYGVMAALAVCAYGLLYAWFRGQRRDYGGAPWWRGQGSSERTQAEAYGNDAASEYVDNGRVPAMAQEVAAVVPRECTVAKPDVGVADVDIALPWDAPVQVNQPGAPVPKHQMVPSVIASGPVGHHEFSDSMTATLRAVNTKEMLDIRQQAEFFMTLGQHQEAVSILAENIDTSDDSNPLVYLDLLKVLHTLGRKTEYDHYRNAFNAIFSGRIPEYADFNHSGNGLQAYPDVCQHIAKLWPLQEAVAYIEECLVNSYDDAHAFDLEAFRDLLMLHGVATRMVSSLDSGFSAFSTSRAVSREPVLGSIADPEIDPILVDVDLDLSEPPVNLIEFDAADLLPTPYKSRPHA